MLIYRILKSEKATAPNMPLMTIVGMTRFMKLLKLKPKVLKQKSQGRFFQVGIFKLVILIKQFDEIKIIISFRLKSLNKLLNYI